MPEKIKDKEWTRHNSSPCKLTTTIQGGVGSRKVWRVQECRQRGAGLFPRRSVGVTGHRGLQQMAGVLNNKMKFEEKRYLLAEGIACAMALKHAVYNFYVSVKSRVADGTGMREV